MATKKNNEQIVKELARKDFNKKCADCGRGGPQQTVNLTLNTFVCTQCAGILRNFNHKVKTINMYTFPDAEVAVLEAGGNQKANAYWMHYYDPENPREFKVEPDDQKNVADFMKMKYIQKKWCIEQPKKKEDPKKEGKKKKGDGKERRKSKAGEEEHLPPAAGGGEGAKKGEEGHEQPKAAAATPSIDASKLKEPTKAKAAGGRKSSGAASEEGQPSTKPAAVAGGIDFLTELESMSFTTPAAAPASSASSGGFGHDFDSGFGSSTKGGAATSGFDSGFGSSAHAANGLPVSSSASSGGLSALVEQAQAVKVSAQAVNALVYQLKTIGNQYQLDSAHIQALALQALGKIAGDSSSTSTSKANGRPGASLGDVFDGLQVPEDHGPGAEPDSGNPFGSDEDDEEPAPAAKQHPHGHHGHGHHGSHHHPQHPQQQQQQQTRPAAPVAAFGHPQSGGFGQPGAFGAPQPTMGGYGAPMQQPGFGAPLQPGGFGAPQPGYGYGAPAPVAGYPQHAGGFGAPAAGGFGPPQGFGAPQAQPAGAPVQQPAKSNPLFDQFNPF